MLSMEKYKLELLTHLRKDKPNCVLSLWSQSKCFFTERGITMGGCYGSMDTKISISLRESKESELIRFIIDLNEI